MKVEINFHYLVLLATAAALGGLLFGFDIAIITGAGPFPMEHFGLDDLGLGWAFSSLLFGCVLGSLAAGRFADRYGRKGILTWVAALFALTSIATAAAPTFLAFLAARFAGGLAVGAASLLSPMYVAEISPPSARGRMGALYQMSVITGILVSYCINYRLRNLDPNNWRCMFFTGIFPSVLFFALMLFALETPRYLMMTGRKREAFRLLERITGKAEAEYEIAEMEAMVHQGGAGWDGLLRPGVKRALAVSCFLAILIYVAGINTIVDYSTAIFRSAGWKIDGALFSTFLVGVTVFLFTIASFWMIDLYGRKPLYVIGSIGMHVILGLILSYLDFFSSCIGPVFWTLFPEIFPTDVRGLAMTVPVLTQWIANALVVLVFRFAFPKIGTAITFAFLAVMTLVQAIFTKYFVPETRNKPLEEIEEFWKMRRTVSR
jgi:MFS transporter, SP family, arabinose:H+ symporter